MYAVYRTFYNTFYNTFYKTLYKRMEANDILFGVVCVLLATLGLSLKAILIKLVYQADPTIDAISVLTIRFVLALPFSFFYYIFLAKNSLLLRLSRKPFYR